MILLICFCTESLISFSSLSLEQEKDKGKKNEGKSNSSDAKIPDILTAALKLENILMCKQLQEACKLGDMAGDVFLLSFFSFTPFSLLLRFGLALIDPAACFCFCFLRFANIKAIIPSISLFQLMEKRLICNDGFWYMRSLPAELLSVFVFAYDL